MLNQLGIPYGFAMTLNEAILVMAIGFMIIVGIWLTALTYLVLGRTKKQEKLKDKEESEEEDSEKESTD
jgi:hypothetical protein